MCKQQRFFFDKTMFGKGNEITFLLVCTDVLALSAILSNFGDI